MKNPPLPAGLLAAAADAAEVSDFVFFPGEVFILFLSARAQTHARTRTHAHAHARTHTHTHTRTGRAGVDGVNLQLSIDCVFRGLLDCSVIQSYSQCFVDVRASTCNVATAHHEGIGRRKDQEEAALEAFF